MENQEKKAGSKKRIAPPEPVFEPLEEGYGGYVAGIDEAGRGALAGPVSVGMVLLPRHLPDDPGLKLIRDSKELSAPQREEAARSICRAALYARVAHESHRIIDTSGINFAIHRAMVRLVQRWPLFGREPLTLLIDGNYRFDWSDLKMCEVFTIVKGDRRVQSIAAASIVAKVSRDRRMRKYGTLYPEYAFERHKGYGTELHLEALATSGGCPIHRRTFCPKPDNQQRLPF
ncbi:MAG: ribonuclease HII [Spirochaetales bacterium]|nr:ribonuclease HII [Spirochaetales bacterium]